MGLCCCSNQPRLNKKTIEISYSEDVSQLLTNKGKQIQDHQLDEELLIEKERAIQCLEEFNSKYQEGGLFKKAEDFLYKVALIQLRKAWKRWREEGQSIFFTTFESRQAENTGIYLYENLSQQLLEQNALLKYLKNCKAMNMKSLMKFMDDLLDRKNEADIADELQNRPYRQLPEFLLDYVNRSFGLKQMASSTLSSLLAALDDAGEDPLISFYCRLLQVFHPDPIHLPLAVYITKARAEFNKLVRQGIKDLKTFNKPRGSSVNRPSQQFSLKRDRIAFLLDVMNLCYSIFESDRFSLAIAIQNLKPSNLSIRNYLMFRLCYIITKNVISVDLLYAELDCENKGFIDEFDFVDGITRNLELFITESDTRHLLNAFGFSNSRISKETFFSKININWYHKKCKEFSVSITDFLSAIAEAYKRMCIKDIGLLESLFSRYSMVIWEVKDFFDFVKKIDTNISFETSEKMFYECLGNESDAVTYQTFCKTAIKYHLAGFGLREFRRECIGAKKQKKQAEIDQSLIYKNAMMNMLQVKK